ncbi:MAG TPA: hypothetical protein VHM70_15525 [Polyangiaceae bacterium]|nr:hypothetical protein [Polyangiaceae bacterium]
MTELRLEARDSAVVMAVFARVMLVIWRGAPTAGRFQMFSELTERMVREFPDGFYQLQIIEAQSPPPASDERKASAHLLERMKGHAKGIAFVIEGDGPRVAIVRTILRGMSMLSRGGVPKYFFAHVEEAVRWLGPVLDPSVAPSAQLLNALTVMRGSFLELEAPPTSRTPSELRPG